MIDPNEVIQNSIGGEIMPRSKADQLEKLKSQLEELERNTKQKKQDLSKKIGELTTEEKKRQHKADGHRKTQKGGFMESILACAHMNLEQNCQFWIGLLKLPGVIEYVNKMHLETGGTQYGSPQQYDEYLKAKLPSLQADIAKRMKKTEDAAPEES
jgi:hypothetical protein